VGAAAYEGSKVFRAYRGTSLGASYSGAIATTDAVALRSSVYPGLYVVTAYVKIGTTAADGIAMCLSITDVQTQDKNANSGTLVGFYGYRYYANPTVRYYNGTTLVQDAVVYPTNTWMKVVTVLDEIGQTWSFEITNAQTAALIYAKTGLAFYTPDFKMDKVRLYVQSVLSNDGTYNMIDAMAVESLPTVSPTPQDCREVKYRGQLLSADINADCTVDLGDFAMLSQSWLNCNDPENSNCLQ